VQTFKTDIRKPEGDSDFEDMCATVYGVVHGDPSPKRNGRRGQGQGGVDVFVAIAGGAIGRIGIQSKRYNDGGLTLKMVQDDVNAADDDDQQIDRMVFATTAPADASLLKAIMALSDARKLAGKFPVEIDFWPEISAHISRHSQLQEHYAPNTPGAQFYRTEQAQNDILAEIHRMANRLDQVISASNAASVPSGRDDSLNRFITSQLDDITDMLTAVRYRDAMDRLTSLAKEFSQFDPHQKGRWYVQRGICKLQLLDVPGAATDFLTAFELYPHDEKIAAARIRGLWLQHRHEDARSAELAARADFPASIPVWISIGHGRLAMGETIDPAEAPVEMRDSPDVLQLLCWNAIQRDEPVLAVEYGQRILATPGHDQMGRAAALAAAVTLANADPVATMHGLISKSARDALQEAVDAFEPRSERLWANQSKAVLPEDTANLAYAYRLLGQADMALKILDEGAPFITMSSKLLSVRFSALRALDRDHEVLALARDNASLIDPSAMLMIADVVAVNGDVALIDTLISRAGDIANTEDRAVLSAFRWIALFRAGRKDESLREITAVTSAPGVSAQVLLVASRILLGNERKAESADLLNRAAAMIPADAPSGQRLMLADVMMLANRYADAATVYAPLATPGHFSELHTKLLCAYVRCGQRAKAKALLDSFPPSWSQDDDARNFAITLAHNAGDWHALLPLAMMELRRAPQHAAPWHLRLVVGVRIMKATDFVAVLSEVPDELQGGARQIADIASLEIRHGNREKGVLRLYRLLRQDLNDGEAAAAFMMTLLCTPHELPFMQPAVSIVAPNCSCYLVDDLGGEVRLTIDPDQIGVMPYSPEFFASSDERALLLLGKRVGDEVMLPMAFNVKLKYKIAAISTAFRRLLELCQLKARSPLGGMKNVVAVQVIREDGKLDMSSMHELLKGSSARSRYVHERYGTQPVTLGMMANELNIEPLDLVLGWPENAPPLKMCIGDAVERAAALELVAHAKLAVIDLATLGYLVHIEAEASLAVFEKVYIGGHSHMGLIDILQKVASDRSSAHMSDANGRLELAVVTDLARDGRQRYFDRLKAAQETYCEVCPAYGTDRVSAEFGLINGKIGEQEYEAALLAQEKNALFVSVDMNMRALATLTLGTSGVWPQPLMSHATATGKMKRPDYCAGVAAMFVGNVSYTSINSKDLYWMLVQGMELRERAMERTCRLLGSPESDFVSTAQMVFDFLEILGRFGVTVGVILAFVEIFCEPLYRLPNCPVDIEKYLGYKVAELVDLADRHSSGLHIFSRGATNRVVMDSLIHSRILAAKARAKEPQVSRKNLVMLSYASRTPTFYVDDETACSYAYLPNGAGHAEERQNSSQGKKKHKESRALEIKKRFR